MVAFFRQFLVVLLVLLQNAVPLVHAHAGGDSAQRGLHLHEFETLRIIADHLTLSAYDHAMDAKSCIVNIGSAIKQPMQNHGSQLDFYPQSRFFLCPPHAAIAIDDALSRDDTVALPQIYFNHNTSRAPPCR